MFRTSDSPWERAFPTESAALWAEFPAFLTELSEGPAPALPRCQEELRRLKAAPRSALVLLSTPVALGLTGSRGGAEKQ